MTIEAGPAESTQRIYARLAGCLFLALIVIALGGSLIVPHIAETATFSEAAKAIAASERSLRFVFCEFSISRTPRHIQVQIVLCGPKFSQHAEAQTQVDFMAIHEA